MNLQTGIMIFLTGLSYQTNEKVMGPVSDASINNSKIKFNRKVCETWNLNIVNTFAT